MMQLPPRFLAPLALTLATVAGGVLAQGDTAPAEPAAKALALADDIPWLTDGQDYYERDPKPQRAEVDRLQLVDAACARAKREGKLVLWHVHRIEEKTLGGRQMYRAPVLDVYTRQVLFADPDVAELATHAFVPLRSVMDQALSDRFDLRPLAFVEPAVVFLDGDGKVVHYVERIRTFHGQWFADLCVRVLERFAPPRSGEAVDGLRQRGLWREALAAVLRKDGKDGADWLAAARLQRLLRQPEEALRSCERALAAGAKADMVAAESGLITAMQGDLLGALPLLERAWRGKGPRAAEAGYWHALATLKLGDEVGAWRRFELVAQGAPSDPFVRRARANATIGPDDRPLGAAFTGFEALAYLPQQAYEGLPKDTTWQGAKLDPQAMARGAVAFLLSQQRDDGGFTDARYAYWPSSEITPNVWVAITSIALTALYEHRDAFPELRARIDRALARGEDYILDPKRLNRGANED